MMKSAMMKKPWSVAILLVFLGCSHGTTRKLASNQPLPTLATTSQAQITIGPSSWGPIGPDFIGFSYEKAILSTPLFRADNAALVSLFSHWGPGILRVGGNTVNETTWTPSGPGNTPHQTSPADIDRLAGFLHASGWKVIYGLNATTSSAALSAQEAAYAAKSLGDRLEDFEIGNEPDLYHSNGLKPATYTYADFQNDWDAYTAAIKANNPSVMFSGAAAASNYKGFTLPFAAARGSQVEQLTQHYYRANGQLATSTIDFLLTADPKLPVELGAVSDAARTGAIAHGYRMAETNSFYNGGAPGVSNGFGTALWMIEYCFTLAQYGAKGANFHGGGNSTGYTPIADDGKGKVIGARAEYYGMLLFSLMGPGNEVKSQQTGTASALMSYALARPDGSMAVVLANNSRTDVVAATVTLPFKPQQAEALTLSAPTLDATSGIQLGGSPIAPDGTWSPSTVYTVSFAAASTTVDVPAGSALMITARP